HYSQITHCRFRNAKEAAVYATGLANGTIFYACHFNIGEGKGFYGDGTGNPLTFIGCWFEHYEDYALELRNAVQTNLYGCYCEIGGSGIEDISAATIRIHPNSFTGTAYSPTNVVFNGCHFGGDQRTQVYARGGDDPDPLHQTIDIKFENCNFTSSG